MRTAVTPHRCGQPAGHDGFVRLLRAEFTKFRSVHTRIVALCAVVVVFVLLSLLSAFESHETNPPVAVGPDGEAVTDAYTLVHQTLAGDGTVTVRVAALSAVTANAVAVSPNGHVGPPLHVGLAPWAKAGIIVEPTTNQGTDYAALMVTGSHGVQLQYNYTHDHPAGPASPVEPQWLRLTRNGDLVAGYDSMDAIHWTEIGTARLTGLPETVQIGLFVTSPEEFTAGAKSGTVSVANATFDHLSTQGDLAHRSWAGEPIGGFDPSTSVWQQRSANSFTIRGSGDIAPLVGGEDAATHWAGASIVNGTISALVIVIVLATLFATSEYRPQLMRTRVEASPRRHRVLAAKAVVAGSLTFAAGTIATALAEVITRHVLAVNGNYLFAQSGAALARITIGTGLLIGLVAALAVGLGTIVQRGAGAIAAGIVLLVVPGVLATATPLSTGAGTWLMRVTPTAAFAIQATLPRSNLVTDAYIPANGYFPIRPWAGLAVLAAYAATALGAAACLPRRRDAHATTPPISASNGC